MHFPKEFRVLAIVPTVACLTHSKTLCMLLKKKQGWNCFTGSNSQCIYTPVRLTLKIDETTSLPHFNMHIRFCYIFQTCLSSYAFVWFSNLYLNTDFFSWTYTGALIHVSWINKETCMCTDHLCIGNKEDISHSNL